MCRLLYIPKGINFKEETLVKLLNSLENSYGGQGNGLGFFAKNHQHVKKDLLRAGFTVSDTKTGNYRVTMKGIALDNKKIASLIKNFERLTTSGIIYHTRLASSGGVNDKMCHPFNCGEGALVIHNGHWAGYRRYVNMIQETSGWKFPEPISDSYVLTVCLNFIPLRELGPQLLGDSILMLREGDMRIKSGSGHHGLKILVKETTKNKKEVVLIASEVPRLFDSVRAKLGLQLYQFPADWYFVYDLTSADFVSNNFAPDSFDRVVTCPTYYNYSNYGRYNYKTQNVTKLKKDKIWSHIPKSKKKRPAGFVSPIEQGNDSFDSVDAEGALINISETLNCSKGAIEHCIKPATGLQLISIVCEGCNCQKCTDCNIKYIKKKYMIKLAKGVYHELNRIVKSEYIKNSEAPTQEELKEAARVGEDDSFHSSIYEGKEPIDDDGLVTYDFSDVEIISGLLECGCGVVEVSVLPEHLIENFLCVTDNEWERRYDCLLCGDGVWFIPNMKEGGA